MHCGCRCSKESVSQKFVLKNLRDKYWEKVDLFAMTMNLEVCDKFVRYSVWKVLRTHGAS